MNYRILIGARSQAKADTAVQELRASSSITEDSDVSAVLLDVTDDSSITAAAKHITNTFGSIDILINNAGISSGPPEAGTRENFRAVFETNLFGPAVVIETFLPLLRASKYHDRRIVNVVRRAKHSSNLNNL